jgi:hypothetical protein
MWVRALGAAIKGIESQGVIVMLRSPRSLSCMCLPALMLLSTLSFVTLPAKAQTDPEWRPLKTGLISVSAADAFIRVASVFTEPDERVVPVTVKFIDGNNVVLREQRGEVRDGQPFFAVMPGGADRLLRVEVTHEMPGCGQRPYPIMVTIQPHGVESRGIYGRYLLERSVSTSCSP